MAVSANERLKNPVSGPGTEMKKERTIRKVIKSKPTLEGAGAHLKRAFGFSELPLFDPFLFLPQRSVKYC
jgi:hypothetical protein